MKLLLNRIFDWLEQSEATPQRKLANQLFPVIVCLILFGIFVGLTSLFITKVINPGSAEKIKIELNLIDVLVGFFLYFVTAIDYALIIGRMSVQNPGSRSRFAMNVFTCLGCFVGVTLVLFLWGFVKEIPLLITILLVFAGSVMIKLAYEGRQYFENSPSIPIPIRRLTILLLRILYYPTRIFTYWIPDLGNPKVEKTSLAKLARWSFLLPFIIGLDDLIGYMGAMTIFNAFGLIFGIYIADILIDILIFVSPKFTKKMVENAFISLLAVFAFLYLAYKSYSESWLIAEEKLKLSNEIILLGLCGFILLVVIVDLLISKTKEI